MLELTINRFLIYAIPIPLCSFLEILSIYQFPWYQSLLAVVKPHWVVGYEKESVRTIFCELGNNKTVYKTNYCEYEIVQ